MKENELTIEIPKGKIVDWDESKKQNKIVFKKQLTYGEICNRLPEIIYVPLFDTPSKDCNALVANEHQLECILAKNKLANCALYLNNGWKPRSRDIVCGLMLEGENCSIIFPIYYWDTNKYYLPQFVFKSEKLAQQAIEILGEETVKLALEPLGV